MQYSLHPFYRDLNCRTGTVNFFTFDGILRIANKLHKQCLRPVRDLPPRWVQLKVLCQVNPFSGVEFRCLRGSWFFNFSVLKYWNVHRVALSSCLCLCLSVCRNLDGIKWPQPAIKWLSTGCAWRRKVKWPDPLNGWKVDEQWFYSVSLRKSL